MSELFDKIFGSFPEMRLMKEELMAKHTTSRIGRSIRLPESGAAAGFA